MIFIIFSRLQPLPIHKFFFFSIYEIEFKNIILFLNPSKAIFPNSIPTKFLKLLINGVSSQLTDLFNLLFSRGVFPSILKTNNVIPVYKERIKIKVL